MKPFHTLFQARKNWPRGKGYLWLFLLLSVFLCSACDGLPQLSATSTSGSVTEPPILQPVTENLSSPPQQAQDNDIDFEHISIAQGLSQNSVYCMLQDRTGFLWFGTQDGLNRYDGYRFDVYVHDPDDASSLRGNTIFAIYEDHDGILWIGTELGGLNRFDRQKGKFSAYLAEPEDPLNPKNTVQVIHESRSGLLWIGTNSGVLKFDRDGEAYVPFATSILENQSILSVDEDQFGVLWFGTSGGLVQIDPQTETIIHHQSNSRDPRALSGNEVSAVYIDQSETLWVGTDSGLHQYDRGSGTFTRYRNDPRDPNSFSGGPVSSFSESSSGELWIGIAGGGMDRLDHQRLRFTHYDNDPSDSNSLSDDNVLTILEDNEGVLWVGTRAGGINKSGVGRRVFAHFRNEPGGRLNFTSNTIRAIYEDRSGVLWVGTSNGLNSFNRQDGTVTHYQNNPAYPNGISDDFILSIHQDREGILWVGTIQGGLNRLNPENGEITHYQNDPRDPLSLSSDTVRAIYQDRAGVIWIGTANGLNRFYPQMEQFNSYIYFSSLGGRAVRVIYEDRAGNLWVGTENGLFKFDQDRNKHSAYFKESDDANSLSNDFILSLYEDQNGTIWIGTFLGGLVKFDQHVGRFTHYRKKDGLPSDLVYGILGDDRGNLWLSTNQGLSLFDPRTETFTNYNVTDGLQSNEFNAGAYYKSSCGEMFFGGVNGFNAFFPDQVKSNAYVPPVVLISLTQGGEQVDVEGHADGGAEVTFTWPNDFFEFEVAALSYTHPEDNQYAYKLEGFDPDWNDVGTRRFGRYTNLPGGSYILRVKGSNNDGVWNEEGLSIKVNIVPPFWETWWFIGSVASLLGGVAVASYRIRVRSVENRSRELEELVEKRTAELLRANEMLRQEINDRQRAEKQLARQAAETAVAEERNRLARDLHDAVTQTLFSASLVAEVMPRLWERDRAEGERRLEELRELTRGALAEMRTLLLELRPTGLVEADLRDLLSQLAESITGRARIPVDLEIEGQCDLSPDRKVVFYRIAQEALNNAAKHAGASRVSVYLRCEPGDVVLRIKDDGRGFDLGSHSPERMGLGIMRERAEAIGANLEISSKKDHGTQVAVRLTEAKGERQ
jgi:ligand-binding sensor domain-containing protein/signal transduction histidine kinase